MLWPRAPRELARGLRALTLAAATFGLAVAVPTATPTAVADITITLDGHGYGHGFGLSQWGAYGYAVDLGWSSADILDRYYGGTVAGTVPLDSMITVHLRAIDGYSTAVVSTSGGLMVDGLVGPAAGPWKSVVARKMSPGVYSVWARSDATVCPSLSGSPSSPWQLVKSGATPSVTIRTQADSSTATDYGALASVCASDGSLRAYRGAIRAIDDGAVQRTVNEVPVEQYLRSVIAKEMSPGWGDDGGGRGAQALQAQAVAARSYGLAENRTAFAKTCDTTACQAYYGAATRTSLGVSFVAVEHVWTDAAVVATAGVVRRVGTVAGPISYTMFSASSGGWTDAGTTALTPFPAVYDDGDDTAPNPNYNWSITLTGSAIAAKYPAIGTFTSLTVLTRNGLGDWGGRVRTVRVTGTSGSTTVSGNAFQSAMGLKSNWFNVRGSAPFDLCPVTGPPPVVTTIASIVGAADDASAPAVRCMEFFAA